MNLFLYVERGKRNLHQLTACIATWENSMLNLSRPSSWPSRHARLLSVPDRALGAGPVEKKWDRIDCYSMGTDLTYNTKQWVPPKNPLNMFKETVRWRTVYHFIGFITFVVYFL